MTSKETAITVLTVGALQKIADGEDGGPLRGHRVDQSIRALFIRRGWLPPDAWDGLTPLVLTDAGEAALAAALAEPPVLNALTGHALRKIRDAGDNGYHGTWPGNPGSLDAAKAYQLVEAAVEPVEWKLPNRWRLTHAGAAALAGWELNHVPPRPTPTQARLLGDLRKADPPSAYDPTFPAETFDACERHGWITSTPRPHPIGSRYEITAAGRAAFDAYQRAGGHDKPRRSTARRDTRSVRELRAGQLVRLSNRRAYPRLNPDWVKVTGVVDVPRVGGMPGGFEVWVEGPDGERIRYPSPVLLHPATRFEIKPEGGQQS